MDSYYDPGAQAERYYAERDRYSEPPEYEKEEILCPQCSGKGGFDEDGMGFKCSACDGTGVVDSLPPVQPLVGLVNEESLGDDRIPF